MASHEIDDLPHLAGGRHNRADHLRRDEAMLAQLSRQKNARFLIPDIASDGDETHRCFELDETPGDDELCFLGFDAEERPLFLPIAQSNGPAGRATNRDIWALLSMMPRDQAGLYATMRAMLHWHQNHRHCGQCGGLTKLGNGGWMRQCMSCNAQYFPRTDPVVIMLAEHEGRVLLGRQPRFPEGNYSALAGFVEPGENLEDAVVRELHEEAGVNVREPRYVASQPWPFPASLMVAFTTRCDDPELTIDTNELEHAFWASRDDVALAFDSHPDARFRLPPPFAIAHHLIRHWFDGRN